MSRFFDFIVIGGGAAGTSVAYELSQTQRLGCALAVSMPPQSTGIAG
jgi:glycine/D-amino acid oxidase-like deaminating enzyme